MVTTNGTAGGDGPGPLLPLRTALILLLAILTGVTVVVLLALAHRSGPEIALAALAALAGAVKFFHWLID